MIGRKSSEELSRRGIRTQQELKARKRLSRIRMSSAIQGIVSLNKAYKELLDLKCLDSMELRAQIDAAISDGAAIKYKIEEELIGLQKEGSYDTHQSRRIEMGGSGAAAEESAGQESDASVLSAVVVQ